MGLQWIGCVSSPDRRFRLRKTTTSGCRIDCYCLNWANSDWIELRELGLDQSVAAAPRATRRYLEVVWHARRAHASYSRRSPEKTRDKGAAGSFQLGIAQPRFSAAEWIAIVRYSATPALVILPLSAWANGLAGRSTRRAAGARSRAKQRAASMGARRRLRTRSRTTKSCSASDAVSGSGESAGAWTRRPPAGRAALIWRGASRPGLRQWPRPRRSTRTLRNCLQTFVQPLTKW